MGNKCGCCVDDDVCKLDEQIERLVDSKNKNMTVGDCDICHKKNEACFQNYGSIDNKKILLCITCDINLEKNVLKW